MRYRIWKLGLVGASGIFIRKYSSPLLPILKCEEHPASPLPTPTLHTSSLSSSSSSSTPGTHVDATPSKHEELDTGPGVPDQCILVVGTTGSGKSSTIAKMTGEQVRVGGEVDSVTRECNMYHTLGKKSEGPVWIDTVGYDDTKCLEDEESFKEVLRYISDKRLLKVSAVVWTVLPQDRCDSRLQKQAAFIDQFRPGTIWDNVIIIAKQPGSFNLERAVQGAKEAAKQLAGTEKRNIQTLGFTYLDSSIPGEMQEILKKLDDGERKEMLIATTEEVVEQVQEALDKIVSPVQVVFEDSECCSCGVVGDRRLLPGYCHMEPLLLHTQVLRHYHTEPLVPIHTLPVEPRHPGVLRLAGGPHEECCTVRNIVMAATPMVGFFEPNAGIASALAAGGIHFLCSKLNKPLAYAFTCCQGEQDSMGCRAPGCARKYRCCNKEEGTAGCKVVCKKCGSDWGTAAGECFRKKHDLKRISTT